MAARWARSITGVSTPDPDPDAEQWDATAVAKAIGVSPATVYSSGTYGITHTQIRRYQPGIVAGQQLRFQVRVNPVIATRGRRRPLSGRDKQITWVTRKLADGGAQVDWVDIYSPQRMTSPAKNLPARAAAARRCCVRPHHGPCRRRPHSHRRRRLHPAPPARAGARPRLRLRARPHPADVMPCAAHHRSSDDAPRGLRIASHRGRGPSAAATTTDM